MNRNPMPSNSKVALFVLMFFFALLIPKGSAQTTFSSMMNSEKTISMDLQDASLADVLKVFSIQSGLNFIASEAVKDRKITLYLDNVPMQEAMVKLFKANKLNYDFDEDANIFTVNYAEDINEPETITKIYQLKYRSVSSANLERESNSLFSGSSAASGSFASTGGGAAAPRGTASMGSGADILDAIKQLLSKNGKVTEDSKTNSIIVTDIPSRFRSVEEVIARLDVPQPQVMLEVEMLDVSKSYMDKMGFQLDPNNPNPLTWVLPGGFNNSKIFIGNTANYARNLVGDLTTTIPADKSLPRTGYPVTQGTIQFGRTYSQVLDFLKQQKDTKFLARPRILTLNNETAEIGITKDVVVQRQVVDTTLGTSGTTSTVSYQRATSLTLTPEGIGVFLRVTPQINLESGEIMLVINPKTSSATQSEYVTTELALDPEVRSTKSIIRVKDGETVMMGGLIHQEREETRNKVPIFGDIPIVGALFRHTDKPKDIDRELIVFITPHIIKDSSIQYSQAGKSAPANPITQSNRRQEIANMLNTFERERSADGQRKVSQARGAFN